MLSHKYVMFPRGYDNVIMRIRDVITWVQYIMMRVCDVITRVRHVR